MQLNPLVLLFTYESPVPLVGTGSGQIDKINSNEDLAGLQQGKYRLDKAATSQSPLLHHMPSFRFHIRLDPGNDNPLDTFIQGSCTVDS